MSAPLSPYADAAKDMLPAMLRHLIIFTAPPRAPCAFAAIITLSLSRDLLPLMPLIDIQRRCIAAPRLR
jgi:hypothetical protein